MQFIKSRIIYYKPHENPYQYYNSNENLYQIPEVTRAASERAMKSKVHMIKSFITIAPSYTGKTITHLLLLALLLVLCTRNNTDGNKLVIFSLYYGDNYIISRAHKSRRLE